MSKIDFKNSKEQIFFAGLPPHIDKDFYEFFVDLGDEPIKQGYEWLINKILRLAEIPEKEYSIRWEGTFDNKKEGMGPVLILSWGQITTRFNLEYQVERVDLKNLLAGLNAFIKKQRPAEQRKLFLLQIYDDQTNCIWFVIEEKLRELCPILHSNWNDYPEHWCTITRSDALKKE